MLREGKCAVRAGLDRHCCDGQCAEGLPCPAFAPGVIDGPHGRSQTRLARRALAWLAAACVLVASAWWLLPTPPVL